MWLCIGCCVSRGCMVRLRASFLSVLGFNHDHKFLPSLQIKTLFSRCHVYPVFLYVFIISVKSLLKEIDPLEGMQAYVQREDEQHLYLFQNKDLKDLGKKVHV